MVYGFAKQSGGLMQIHSEPGHGTAVKLFFPRITAPHRADAPRVDQIAAPAGAETILVVEDNDLVRTYVEKELKELGYRIIAARNGPEALAILRQPREIDLLFTDIVMPGGMFGPELAKQASRLRPELKVLFTSGYTEQPVQPLEGLDGEARILNKPYRRNDLALMLRTVLKGK
jgi:CheY-like chemotaxis protein